MKPILAVSNLPDATTAERLARVLIDRREAACVNILAPCTSVYRWQGAVQTEPEVPVLIKTTADRFDAVAATVRELHPYTLPELIAVDLTAGLPAYLDWVIAQTRPAD